VTTGLTNDFVELTINSMKHFTLFVTTKQSAYNFSGPPRRGREKNFFARFAREPGPLINIFVILTLRLQFINVFVLGVFVCLFFSFLRLSAASSCEMN